MTYLISDLSPNTTYLIRVASQNPAGLSDWMGPQEFRTHPGPIESTSAATLIPNSITMYFIHLLIVYLAYDVFVLNVRNLAII